MVCACVTESDRQNCRWRVQAHGSWLGRYIREVLHNELRKSIYTPGVTLVQYEC